MTSIQLSPARMLRQRVRAGFIQQGTTYTAWCKKKKKNRSNCNAALAGAWEGPAATKLREEILRAAGVADA